MAVARHLTHGAPEVPSPRLSRPVLLAIGSHDPISLTQVERLAASGAATVSTAPDGLCGPLKGCGAELIWLTAVQGQPFDPRAAGERFAQGIAQLVKGSGVRTLLGCGGETADAILGALGVGVLAIEGEVLPGIPVSRMLLGERRLQLVTKSGGFGGKDALVLVVEAAAANWKTKHEGRDGFGRTGRGRRAAGETRAGRPYLPPALQPDLTGTIRRTGSCRRRQPWRRSSVSRPVLRAALERLREQGLIHSRQGAGSYVREVKTVPLGFARVETIADIQRCYEFRICIETMASRLAAGRRNAEALEEIATALSLMRGATDLQTHREDADFAFHLAIAKAANNQYFEASMRALREHIFVGMKLHGQSLMTDGAKASATSSASIRRSSTRSATETASKRRN